MAEEPEQESYPQPEGTTQSGDVGGIFALDHAKLSGSEDEEEREEREGHEDLEDGIWAPRDDEPQEIPSGAENGVEVTDNNEGPEGEEDEAAGFAPSRPAASSIDGEITPPWRKPSSVKSEPSDLPDVPKVLHGSLERAIRVKKDRDSK